MFFFGPLSLYALPLVHGLTKALNSTNDEGTGS